MSIPTSIFHLVAVACLAVPIAARSTGSATGDCAARAGEFRERLETVIEAAVDGRPAVVPAAGDSVQAWWRANGALLGQHAGADSLLPKLVRAAHVRRVNEAAQLAVRLSTESFGWCAGALSTTDQLMVLDLTGMAAWLSAKGLATPAPADSRTVMETLAATLQRTGHAALAVDLRKIYAGAEPQPGGKVPGVRAAVRLLDYVDVIEKALH